MVRTLPCRVCSSRSPLEVGAPTWGWHLVCRDQTTTNVTKVLWLLLRQSPKQPFPVKWSCCSGSLEQQPQNFRDISGRLNQHPRLQLWLALCIVEFAAAGTLLKLGHRREVDIYSAEIRRPLMSRKFCGCSWESPQSNHSLRSDLAVVYLWNINHKTFVTLVVVWTNIQGYSYDSYFAL